LVIIEDITRPWREIVYPSGKTISQVKRYIQKTTLSGSLNMPILKEIGKLNFLEVSNEENSYIEFF